MTKERANVLMSAAAKILRPLVRLLLRNGITFKQCSDLLKWVYVQEGKHSAREGYKEASFSKVAVVTGIQRKEVQRVSQLPTPERASSESDNRAARVVTGWLQDPYYADETGKASRLPLKGEGKSFAALVKQYSGDIPLYTVLDELIRVGAVEVNEQKQVRLLTRGYIPQLDDEEKINILGEDVADLIQTINHNILHPGPNSRVQLRVCYNNLPVEVLAKMRRLSQDKAHALMEDIDGWMRQYDRDFSPNAKGTGRARAGMGIFYFEDIMEEEDA